MSEAGISQPLVSVIMPTYNQAGFLNEAIESVLKQTYKNFELIIIDNYSNDDTEEIAKLYAYRDSRVRYIKFSNNGVIAKSRNIGIIESRGAYLAFLDSDDSWLEKKLKRVIEFLVIHPDVDMICHDEYHVNLINNKTKIVKYGPNRDYANLLFKGNAFSTSAVVVRRSKVLEAGLFCEDEKFITAEDYELWMRLSKISRIAFLHEVLGKFNIHGKSSSKRIEKHMISALNVVNYHFNQFKSHTLFYKYLLNKRLGSIYRSASNQSLRTKDRKFALKTITAGLRLNPISLKTWISLMLILSVYIKDCLAKKQIRSFE